MVALACGSKTVDKHPMEVCLLRPEDITELLDDEGPKQQHIIVTCLPRKSLRAKHGDVEKTVQRNRLDEWSIPGS